MKSIVSILIALFLLLPGCGKKGPPVPPRQSPVPSVSDLKYSIDGSILTLTWTIPKEKEGKKAAFDGFILYRYKSPITNSPCKNCPKLFHQVADIKINNFGNGIKNMKHRDEVEKGFAYTYKVILYTKNGVSGADSNYVNFNY
ncbi:MAG: hypothetical protein HKO91_11130 [Desulfobacterales bacterium]|nr:hypothetical protein [Desulfobacterales bacterium]